MRLKTGDQILVIAGKDKNKVSKVLKVYVETNKVLAEGVNIATKHMKKKQSGEQGRIVKIEKPIDASNVMLVCPFTQKRTRVGYIGKGKDKRRVSKKADKPLDNTYVDSKKKK